MGCKAQVDQQQSPKTFLCFHGWWQNHTDTKTPSSRDLRPSRHILGKSISNLKHYGLKKLLQSTRFKKLLRILLLSTILLPNYSYSYKFLYMIDALLMNKMINGNCFFLVINARSTASCGRHNVTSPFKPPRDFCFTTGHFTPLHHSYNTV